MRLLVVGGSGYVGRLVLPYLADRFTVRVFDIVPPSISSVEWFEGDVTDPDALMSASAGMDVLLYMAMGSNGEKDGEDSPVLAYDVNVKGLHLALDAALSAGMSRGVLISTVTVYTRHPLSGEEPITEEEAPAPRTVYGLTKLLAEEVCRHFSRWNNFPILSLRIFKPLSREDWLSNYDTTRVEARISAPDLARAIVASLETERSGFDALHITGDYLGRAYPFDRAKRSIGWEPLERPIGLPNGRS